MFATGRSATTNAAAANRAAPGQRRHVYAAPQMRATATVAEAAGAGIVSGYSGARSPGQKSRRTYVASVASTSMGAVVGRTGIIW